MNNAELQRLSIQEKIAGNIELENLKLKREKIMHKNIMEEIIMLSGSGIKSFTRGRDMAGWKEE